METNRRIQKGPSREERTRTEILEATKRLVERHGLQKVTMEDIASALGKKKSFLYYYYPGRREVLRALIEHEFNAMRERVRKAVDARPTAADKLSTYLVERGQSMIDQTSRYGSSTIVSMLQSEDGVDLVGILGLRKQFDLQEARFIAAVLRQGIRDGEFRPLPARVIEDVTYFLLTSVRGIELDLALSDEPRRIPPSRVGQSLAILLRGLAK
jgi:AcrR family transcriptional regulator